MIPEKDFLWYQKPDFRVGTIVSFLVPENDLMVQRKRLLETTHGWRYNLSLCYQVVASAVIGRLEARPFERLGPRRAKSK